MIKIRLSKKGAKNSLFYRIVAMEKKSKATGKYLGLIGYYNPSKKDIKFDKEKYNFWLAKGAQVSDRVKSLIGKK